MSTFGIFAFIVMPILGGLIAWAGDVIGYRLGKSRRSLFGLRPRSTARLIGVAVGVILPLLSLGLAMLASNDAKVALLHLDALRRVQSDLQQSNAKLRQQTQALHTQITVAKAEAQRSARHSAALRGSLRATARQLVNADQRLQATQSRLTSAQREVADLRSARDTLRRAKALLEQQVGLRKQQAERLEGKVSEAHKTLKLVSDTLATTEAALNSSQAELARQRAALGSPIIYESGHELLRAIVEVGDTPEETTAKLTSVLAAASAIAAASNAKTGPNGLSVKLVKGMPPTATFTSERDILLSTAAELQKAGKRKFVVIARVTRRLYEGEAAQAQVEFYPLPYALAFTKGETVCSVVIDGSQPRGEVFSQLWNLVTKLVRREAGKHGLLRDPDTGQYGSLPANELLQALEAVSASEGPVTVRVRTEKDTYISDALVIKIEVGDQEPGAGHADGVGD